MNKSETGGGNTLQPAHAARAENPGETHQGQKPGPTPVPAQSSLGTPQAEHVPGIQQLAGRGPGRESVRPIRCLGMSHPQRQPRELEAGAKISAAAAQTLSYKSARASLYLPVKWEHLLEWPQWGHRGGQSQQRGRACSAGNVGVTDFAQVGY